MFMISVTFRSGSCGEETKRERGKSYQYSLGGGGGGGGRLTLGRGGIPVCPPLYATLIRVLSSLPAIGVGTRGLRGL